MKFGGTMDAAAYSNDKQKFDGINLNPEHCVNTLEQSQSEERKLKKANQISQMKRLKVNQMTK